MCENELSKLLDLDAVVLRNLLIDSLKNEKELKRLLNEQVLINEKLKLELEIEKRKTSIKVESSTEESEKSYKQQEQVGETLKDTFGTNSGILMQYKYDDLRDCYIKSVKKINKKNKQLKKVIQDAEFQRFLNIQLQQENVKLHEKIEDICHRYIMLMDKRCEERSLSKNIIQDLQHKLQEISHM